ncbi:hypothetical protein [Aeromonas veronii]|uniref:hypothetical protein n=1 Tax=Aeromonas veronii TaxID=654 RepID=UPI001F0A1C69|nr:hypothetical protein [Aeromonas veronii]
MLALNWLSIAFALWVFGMKKSYRSWQVKTGHLFVDGRSGSGSSTKNGSADETSLRTGGGTSRFSRFRTDAGRQQPGNPEFR